MRPLLRVLTASGLFAVTAAGNPGAMPLFGVSSSGGRNGETWSIPLQIIVLFTALTLLPAVIMSVTPFLRITLVLHFLRQALGTQSAPSNQVLIGLSLFLTALLIQPVAADMYRLGWEPLEQGKLSRAEAFEQGTRPLKAYLTKFAREKDVAMLVQITRTPPPRTPQEIELRILVPAYVLSELKAGFQVGAVLFLPFLVIDLVVASLTLSLGMVQLPPVMLSAPFKILLFVLVDGWNLVIGSLLRSFA